MKSAKASVSFAHLAPHPNDASPSGGCGGWPSVAGRDSVCIDLPFLPRSIGALNELSTADFTKAGDPLALFKLWLEEAAGSNQRSEAMTLATVDADGLPDAADGPVQGGGSARHRLLHEYRERQGARTRGGNRGGGAFSTGSRCGARSGSAGYIRSDPRPRATPYFASRPRGSQIGAWASQQSRTLPARGDLEAAVESYERRFGSGDVPRPDYWRGYRLEPVEIGVLARSSFAFARAHPVTRSGPKSAWDKRLLYP